MNLLIAAARRIGRVFGIGTQSREELHLSIVQAYGTVLARDGASATKIVDLSALPYSKERIEEAIIAIMRLTPAGTTRSHLLLAAMTIPYYQPGVGPDPLHLGGFDLTQYPVPAISDPDGIRAVAQRYLDSAKSASAIRFNEMKPTVDAEMRRIARRLQIMSVAAQ